MQCTYRKALQYHVPMAILLVITAGWTVFLIGFGILASCCRDLSSIFNISHWFVILLLPVYVTVAIVNMIKNRYWQLKMINIIMSTIYILCCGNLMCLFWISVATSDGKLLVGNALGLTGILISALFVVVMLALNQTRKVCMKDTKPDTTPTTGRDNATLIDMKKNEVYGVNIHAQQARKQQQHTAAYEEVPS